MQFLSTDGLRTYIFEGVDIDTVAARRASGDRRDNLYMLISITFILDRSSQASISWQCRTTQLKLSMDGIRGLKPLRA